MRLIAGMHRSGTSLVARLALEAGADLGEPETFFRPDRWNPDGYFEQPDIHAVNMPLIHGHLGRLSYFCPPSERIIRGRARVRHDEIRRVDAAYRGKVVKENRFCLTLAAWLAEGAHVESLLFVLREPFEVARSLRKRNRAPLRLGYSLWLAHNRRLLAAAEEHEIPICFVRYRHVLDPVAGVEEVERALAALGLRVGRERVRELVSEIVHSRSTGAATSPPRYPAQVDALWCELCLRHVSQLEPARTLLGALS